MELDLRPRKRISVEGARNNNEFVTKHLMYVSSSTKVVTIF